MCQLDLMTKGRKKGSNWDSRELVDNRQPLCSNTGTDAPGISLKEADDTAPRPLFTRFA